MRTLTHYRLAKHCLFLLPPDPMLKNAFLIGCVEPDVNLFSHIDFYKAQKLPHFKGHNHPYLRKRIRRMANKLTTHHQSLTPLYAFRLGVLLHYLADAFTFAHNLEFSGDFAAHNAYENAFHRYFTKRIQCLPNRFWQTKIPFSYEKLRAHYLQQAPSMARDFCHILFATRSALHALKGTNNKILR